MSNIAGEAHDWQAWLEELRGVPPLEQTVFRLNNLIFLGIFIIVLVLCKYLYSLHLVILYQLRTPDFAGKPLKSLDALLVEEDNKAVAVSFASFAFGVCVVMSGAFDQLNVLTLGQAVGSGLTFVGLGVAVVLLAKLINASTLSSSFRSANDMMIYQGNMASASLDASSFIGSAIMIRSVLLGPISDGLGVEVAKVLVLWLVLRVVLMLLTLVRQLGCNVIGDAIEKREAKMARADGQPIAASASVVSRLYEGVPADTSQLAVARAMPTLTYTFTNVRRQMTTKAAVETNDMHAGLVLSADVISSAFVVSAPSTFTAALSAIVTWAAYASLAHGLVVVAIDTAVYRTARLNFARSTRILGAVVLEVACVLASAQFVAAQFREVYAPVATSVSTGFAEMADAVFSVSLTAAGFVQLILFSCLLVGFIFSARVTFSVEYMLLDWRAGRPVGLEPIETPAVAVSYAGYCIAHSLIFAGLLDCVSTEIGLQLLNVLIWGALGSAALVFSQLSANKLLLRTLPNAEELRKDNMAVALVDFGHSIGAGLIIKSTVSGDAPSLAGGVVGFLIFYLASQLLFLLFSLCYQAVTKYNDIELFRQKNVAAALGHCLSQIALGYMLSSPIYKTNSLAVFAIQAGVSMLLLLLLRLFVDKALLPMQSLDIEIERDLNWGAALIEGAFALGTAVFVDALLPAGTDEFCNQLILLVGR